MRSIVAAIVWSLVFGGVGHAAERAGSAFFVSHTGALLTTASVLGDGCQSLTIENPYIGKRAAFPIAVDHAAGHAIIGTEVRPSRQTTIANKFDLWTGDMVMAFGYADAIGFDVKLGTVTSTAGGGDGTTLAAEQFRTSLTVEPGFGGGPVVDRRGLLLGLIVAEPAGGFRLDDGAMLKAALDKAGIAYDTADTAPDAAVSDTINAAKHYVVKLRCIHE